MTDWARVERLRGKGRSWEQIAEDERVGFQGQKGSSSGKALKVLYFQRRSRRGRSLSKGAEAVRARGNTRLSKGRMMILGGTVAGAAVLVAVLLLLPSGSVGKPTGWVGRTAPDFTLMATSGSSFTLSQERGKTNVLLFFNEGLSCSPCLNQMIQLDHDASEFQSISVQIVQITGDSLSDMTTWAQQNSISNTIILADPTLGVCNAYETTGSAVSMMPGTAPGHTFILVNETGKVVWRDDYGPSVMSVPDSEILANVQSALSN